MSVWAETPLEGLKKQQRIANVLNSFAAANKVVSAAFGWETVIEIEFPNTAIAHGGLLVEVNAIKLRSLPLGLQAFGKSAITRGSIQNGSKVLVFEPYKDGFLA